ncbi:YjcB family protein [uncultured Cedecea sp.]|uniref:YjcB family protein n=1 Tax=uncultured Cedecea sp. TaxID=988762 RepID=UPI00260E9BBD|nr:YjcB family protein [uncultured Cedecea sp.]
MGTITAGVVLMRWPLISATLMFMASTLNIKLRRSHYPALAIISTMMGVSASCWFATSLLGLTSAEMATSWMAVKDTVIEVMSQTPPTWPLP